MKHQAAVRPAREQLIVEAIESTCEDDLFISDVASLINRCGDYGFDDSSCDVYDYNVTRPDPYWEAVRQAAGFLIAKGFADGNLLHVEHGKFMPADCAPTCFGAGSGDDAGYASTGVEDQRLEIAIMLGYSPNVLYGLVNPSFGGAGAAINSSRGGGCSFSPDTQVLMADGSTRSISELDVGDLVETEQFVGLPGSLQRTVANDPKVPRVIAQGRAYLGMD